MNSLSDKIFNIKSEEDFNKLCMNLFDLQMENNPIYSPYAKIILKGKNPNNINEIPFLPIEFFKTDQIICTGQKIEEIFLSSGTTGNQSKHLISDLEIYKNSFRKSFHQFYGNISEYCILSLLPNYREREGSSLIYMVDDLIYIAEKFRPQFAISIYHKNRHSKDKLIDSVEIPFKIMKYFKNYNYFVDHYSFERQELILYCLPN